MKKFYNLRARCSKVLEFRESDVSLAKSATIWYEKKKKKNKQKKKKTLFVVKVAYLNSFD